MVNLEFPDEDSVRQYVLCTAKKIGIFDANTGFYPERIAQQFRLDLEEDEVMKLATDCADKNEQNSPVDVWAYRGHQCLMSGKIGDRVRNYIRQKSQEQ
uniref:Odorant binding protein 16 n=1 Tax=Liriomyza sativae TaxID=127406 RepID=A0A0X9LEC4_LIRSA|nr:odorant binding protein 16 [Liriomyza sativae]